MGGNWAHFVRSQKSLGLGQELIEKFLPSQQIRKVSTHYVTGNKVGAPPLSFSSRWLRLLPSPWRCGPSPQRWVGPRAIYQRRIQEDLWIGSINWSGFTLRQLLVQHVMQRGLMFKGWGLGSTCEREIEIKTHKIQCYQHILQSISDISCSHLDFM